MTGVKDALGGMGRTLRSAGQGMGRTLGPIGSGLGEMVGTLGRPLRGLARRPGTTVVVLGVLVIIVGVIVGLLWNSDRDHEDEVDARRDAAATARDSVARMLTYRFDTVDSDLDAVSPLLTGAFREEFSNLVRTQIGPISRQQQATSKTRVVEDSVISSNKDEVRLLLFLAQETSSPLIEKPVSSGSSVRVTMERSGGNWLVSDFDPL